MDLSKIDFTWTTQQVATELLITSGLNSSLILELLPVVIGTSQRTGSSLGQPVGLKAQWRNRNKKVDKTQKQDMPTYNPADDYVVHSSVSDSVRESYQGKLRQHPTMQNKCWVLSNTNTHLAGALVRSFLSKDLRCECFCSNCKSVKQSQPSKPRFKSWNISLASQANSKTRSKVKDGRNCFKATAWSTNKKKLTCFLQKITRNIPFH